MGAIGSVLVSLLIGDQIQHRRQIQHWLWQQDPQEQAHLSHAQRQAGVRVQAGHLTGRGQGACRRGSYEPPLWAPASAATGRESDGPG
jgi:hypothetical protein